MATYSVSKRIFKDDASQFREVRLSNKLSSNGSKAGFELKFIWLISSSKNLLIIWFPSNFSLRKRREEFIYQVNTSIQSLGINFSLKIIKVSFLVPKSHFLVSLVNETASQSLVNSGVLTVESHKTGTQTLTHTALWISPEPESTLHIAQGVGGKTTPGKRGVTPRRNWLNSLTNTVKEYGEIYGNFLKAVWPRQLCSLSRFYLQSRSRNSPGSSHHVTRGADDTNRNQMLTSW